MWLQHMIEALLPCVERLTVTVPALAEYLDIEQRLLHPERVAFRSFPWRGDKRDWLAMLKSPHRVTSDVLVLTYLDVVLRKAAGVQIDRLADCPVWGIWFMPAPRKRMSLWNIAWLTNADYRKQRRQQLILRRPPRWLSGAWVCDPLLQERISPRQGQSIHTLPDAWPSRPVSDAGDARKQLGLPAGETLFLHLGDSSNRKGLLDAIGAWERIADLPRVTLVRAGVMAPGQADAMKALILRGRAILHEGYVPDKKMDLYLRACDWILMPYRQHEGSSGLLSGAAAAGRPVISSDYGLLGYRVSSSRLGIVFPHMSVEGLADAVRRATSTPIEDFAGSLGQFSAGHTVADFAAALRSPLGLTPRSD